MKEREASAGPSLRETLLAALDQARRQQRPLREPWWNTNPMELEFLKNHRGRDWRQLELLKDPGERERRHRELERERELEKERIRQMKLHKAAEADSIRAMLQNAMRS